MPASVRFYRDVLGMEVIYGDEKGVDVYLCPRSFLEE
jgi:catechol 2,3-dioxygenase-like lactoylglutathione lyase family enzyme